MPLYEYYCKCGIFEEVQKVGENKAKCPICGKEAKRLISSPAVIKMEFRDGWDSGAGKYFSTRKDRQDWLKESGSSIIRD